ncbi:filamentous hemagglutinin N-terminal domain-containing protein [Iningainema tapete]|uniref:Filamentous hemagglutinin N-terminal domain-containing protein n=1 Tax=Iningainema tapete BLCC-T55 TaxID=2748662 RepID=A0A8J7C6U9_9CYAN|nr:filamentous hemagglutinin N-terminal domain-containing protein [Iningainema tapete BLCC-T55]
MKSIACQLCIVSLTLGYLFAANSANAQIVPDNTLPVNSSVTPGCTTCQIEGGTISGSTLLHSFREFSVQQDGAAIFNNHSDIKNIITRVTGNTVSNIDGLIRANGTANLLLINPNGIIFGPNAKLDIGGSFLTSTASSFKFTDGNEFIVIPTEATLSISVRINPGCVSRNNVASTQSTFTINGEGGLPANLNDIFPGEETLVELVDLPDSKNSNDAAGQNVFVSSHPSVAASSSHRQEIVEAQGWVVDANGAVTLVAQVSNIIPHSPALNTASCQTSLQQ